MILSVGLGVKIIEKHFTISKNHSSFRDHKLSLEPNELKIFVKIKEAKKLWDKETSFRYRIRDIFKCKKINLCIKNVNW